MKMHGDATTPLIVALFAQVRKRLRSEHGNDEHREVTRLKEDYGGAVARFESGALRAREGTIRHIILESGGLEGGNGNPQNENPQNENPVRPVVAACDAREQCAGSGIRRFYVGEPETDRGFFEAIGRGEPEAQSAPAAVGHVDAQLLYQSSRPRPASVAKTQASPG